MASEVTRQDEKAWLAARVRQMSRIPDTGRALVVSWRALPEELFHPHHFVGASGAGRRATIFLETHDLRALLMMLRDELADYGFTVEEVCIWRSDPRITAKSEQPDGEFVKLDDAIESLR